MVKSLFTKLKKYYQERFGSIFPVFVWLIVFVWVVSYVFFLFWGITTSLKSSTDFFINPVGLPKKEYGGVKISNYAQVWKTLYTIKTDGSFAYIEELLANSLFYCCAIAIINNLIVMMNTYVAARFKHIKFVPLMWVIYEISSQRTFMSPPQGVKRLKLNENSSLRGISYAPRGKFSK